jgi:hypothetical protein
VWSMIHTETCEVGHFCNSASYHSWPPFHGTGKFLWCYTWLLHNNLANCSCAVFSRVSLVVLCFLWKD